VFPWCLCGFVVATAAVLPIRESSRNSLRSHEIPDEPDLRTFGLSNVATLSTLDHPTLGSKQDANRIAVIPLDLDVGIRGLAAGSTLLFQLCCEARQKFSVARQTLDDGHCFSFTTSLFDPQPRRDSSRHSFFEARRTSATLLRPTAFRADPPGFGGVHGPTRLFLRHARRIPKTVSRICNSGHRIAFTPYLCHTPCLG